MKIIKVMSIVGCFLIFSFSCRNNPPKGNTKTQKAETIQAHIQTPISQVLLQKIDHFINATDTSEYRKWPVISLLFSDSERGGKYSSNCIWITNSMAYQSRQTLGYFGYRNKAIGVVNYRGSYFDDFIDTLKLKRGIPEGILDEFPGFSEPWTMIFEIIDKDSLHLIYNGYL